MFYTIIINLTAIFLLIAINLTLLMAIYKSKGGLNYNKIRRNLIFSGCFPIITKIIGASLIAKNIQSNFLKCVLATIILYNNNINFIFLSNNFYDLNKNCNIFFLHSDSMFKMFLLQIKIIILNNIRTWALVCLFFLTDDSIFFVEGCKESSFLSFFLEDDN